MGKNLEMELDIENENRRIRHYKGIANYIMTGICIVFSTIFLYFANYGSISQLGQRSLLLVFVIFLIFLFHPMRKKDNKLIRITDILLASLGGMAFLRVFLTQDQLIERAGQAEFLDLIFGSVAVILTIEAIRRTTGWIMPLLIIIFIIYAFMGSFFPGLLWHQGISYERFIEVIYLGTNGIFDVPIAAVAKFILVYIILGSILQRSGTGQVFIDIALALFGRFRGGSAKVAVISSSLFGSVSGAAVSNVMATGTITIPLMKSTGFRARIAGAIESVASTGGQLMPPVMGATVFVMAEIMGVSYLSIITAALIPAILYYVSLIIMVDLEAAKLGLKSSPKGSSPKLGTILRERGHLLLPLLVLIFFLAVVKYSPQKSAFFAILSAIVAPQLRKKTRMHLKEIIYSLKDGARNVLMVGAVCAGAGIVIGIVMYSGLAVALSSLLVELSGGFLIILLILTAGASIILGMGLPTTAAYLVLAILIAPAIIELGVDQMAAHLFILYFGILSNITPPVAMAAYAGATLANTDPIRTAITASRFGLAGFIIPFIIVYSPGIMLDGSSLNILTSIVSSVIGVYGMAIAMQNFLFNKLSLIERIMFFIGSITLIIPEIFTDILGYTVIVAAFTVHYLRSKKAEKPVPTEETNV